MIISSPRATGAMTHALPIKSISGLPDDDERFTIELEFVQCLANPDYLHWLALNKYLEDPAFVQFLNYLHYWKTPPYCRFIL